MAETNWAGTYTYRARRLHRPASVEELQELVAAAPRLRVLGTRHSFSGIADSEELVTLERLPAAIDVDIGAGAVTLTANVTYGRLAGELERRGVALANLASLPHIGVAGAVATATHGSGDGNGNLATAVTALEFIRGDGELSRAIRGDPAFDGLVVGLGAAGVVTRLTIEVEPFYEVTQHVFERLEWEDLFEHFDEITSSGYSVSIFTRWGARVDQVWVKRRCAGDGASFPDVLVERAVAAAANRHPIPGLDAVNCTLQLGIPGPWYDRLPHFRLGFMPSSGAEIQSEYLVPRGRALEAIGAVRALGDAIRPLVQICEIRTVAADRLWMSPQYGRATVGIHFTWAPEPEAVRAALVHVEEALAPYEARPHWGKLFLMRAERLAPLYERTGDFVALLDRVDPGGTFRNDWLADRLGRS